jgi:hypothetical protein
MLSQKSILIAPAHELTGCLVQVRLGSPNPSATLWDQRTFDPKWVRFAFFVVNRCYNTIYGPTGVR